MNLLFKSKSTGTKITRDTFLYLDPKPPADQFAQCATCLMWTGDKVQTCTIHGRKVKVTGGMSCGLYVHGKPVPDQAGQERAIVTPKESGLVDRPVRCENCSVFDEKRSRCIGYETLNKALPQLFALDAAVHPQGCCNAQTPKK